MHLVTLATICSTALAVYGTIPYILAILRGKTKPHQLSWLVFVIMNGIVAFSQFLEGGRGSVVIAFVFFVGSAIVFLLSLKYGERGTSRWDRALFCFALLAIVAWILTKNNAVAIWLTLFIDLAATSMIVLKVRAQPKSEDPTAWTIATVAYVFTCLTLMGKPLGILYVRPIYGLVCDAALVAAIYYYRRRGRGMVVETSPLEV